MKNQFVVFAFLGGIALLHFSSTAVAQPMATTQPATSITTSNATINGTVNPNGALAVGYYQYGLTTNYDNLGGFVALPATNTTQTLTGLLVNAVHGAAGANWTQSSAPGNFWYSIASSADGLKLAAVAGGINYSGGIYTSTDGGVTWTLTIAPTQRWTGIASSADGTRLVAVAYNDGVYTSTNGGATWTQTSAPLEFYSSIATSVDGTQLAASAALGGGGIYTSTDGGNTWTQSGALTFGWWSIASSADGGRLAAVPQAGGKVYTSTNGGAAWTATTLNVTQDSVIASSADGLKLAVAVVSGYINTSTDGGVTWTAQTGSTIEPWTSIASSADGTRLTAVAQTDGTYTSTDGGNTWTEAYVPLATWQSIASSADGSQLAVVANGPDGIITSSGTVSPLATATPYHYRVVGLNSAGTSLGNDLTFATSVEAPMTTTLAASGITTTNATLTSAVNPNGAATAVYFQYGLTVSYGSYSATNELAATNITLSVTNIIGGLTPNTSYHFQVVATNSGGESVGGDVAFTTLPLPPIVTTLPATGITETTATFNGTVDPSGSATTFYFQYGLTTNYGSYSPTNALAAGSSAVSVFDVISHLAPGTAYHFQLVAGNSGGTSVGGDLTFTNSAGAPIADTFPASSVTSFSATLNGEVYPDGIAFTAYFRYGLTTNYGSVSATTNLAATNATLEVSKSISPLSAGTTYHFELVASNSLGVLPGGDMSFTTAPGPPLVTTHAATSITASSAVLNGTVNPSGAAAGAYFLYGLTTNYGSFSATNSVAATNTPQAVSTLLGSLSPSTTYHFRLMATNSVAPSRGADLTFTTASLQPVNFLLTGSMQSPVGPFIVSFTNLSGLSFTVLGTTNVALPLTNWSVLGTPTEAPPGQYQFPDPQATNSATRYYSVRSP